jgi:hypothetical protein
MERDNIGCKGIASMDAIMGRYRVHLERTGLVLSHEAGLSFDLTPDETLWLLDFINVYRQTLITIQRETDPHIERIAVDGNDDCYKLDRVVDIS